MRVRFTALDVRGWYRRAPLRREWKARAASFRAPETTIEVSRGPLRIYGVEGRREWIVVRTMRDDREYQLSLTKRFFLDEVWNALVAAGAIPRSGRPARRDRL